MRAFKESYQPSYSQLKYSIPVLIPDFDNPFPVTGTGMENCILKFWEREWEWEITFPTFGNGNEKIIPNFREREWEASIPGNGREREFPLTPGGGDVWQKKTETIEADKLVNFLI